MAMTLKILQVLIILPRKIYNFTKDNSPNKSFLFILKKTRPKVISSKYNRVCLYKEKLKVIPPPPELSLETTQPKVISPKSNCGRFPFTYT